MMKHLRTRFLAAVLTLSLLPTLLLAAGPVAADPRSPVLPVSLASEGSTPAALIKGGEPTWYGVIGLIQVDSPSPVGLRLEVWHGHAEQMWTATATANSWMADGFVIGGVIGNVKCPTSVMDLFNSKPLENRSDKTCLLYFTAVPESWNSERAAAAPKSKGERYRIVASRGGKWGEVTVEPAGLPVLPPVFPGLDTVGAPLLRLTETANATPAAEPAPAPKPEPVAPSLSVSALPAQTDLTYLPVLGTATPGAAVRLEVGGQEASTFLVAQAGIFGLGATLQPGENHLKVTATKDGKSTTFEATVTQAPKVQEAAVTAEPQVTFVPPTPALPVAPTDLKGHWAEKIVDLLVSNGSVKTFGDGTFRPEDGLTRAAFAQLVADAFHLPNVAPLTLEPSDQQITRADAAVVTARALRLAGIQAESVAALSFTDADQVPLYALIDTKLAVAAGLYTGFPDGSFRPGQLLTRAEAAQIIERAIGLMNR